MKKFIILLLILVLPGCRKTKEVSVNFTPVSSSVSSTVASYTAIHKEGIVHLDTMIYFDETMSNGVPIKAGETITLIGESDLSFLVIYGDYKGYIYKSHVLLLENEDSDDDIVVENENVQEYVETYIISEKPNFITESATTAAPPATMYTTNKQNNESHSKELTSQINNFRLSANLSSLEIDSTLQKEAAYYCDIFAKENSVSKVNGYNYQAVGKVNDSGNLDKVGKNIVSNIVGFNDNSISKVGVSVIEGERGDLYYVVIAK